MKTYKGLPKAIGRTNKGKVLNLLLLVLLATLLSSAGLSSIQLQIGLPFPTGTGTEEKPVSSPDTFTSKPVLQPLSPTILLIVSSLFLLYLLFLLFSQTEGRRILLWVLLVCFFIGLIAIFFGNKQTMPDLSFLPQEPPSEIYKVGPVGSAPPVFIWLAIGGFVVLASAFGFWLYQTSFKFSPTRNLIKEEVKNAIKEIEGGGEWRNVVIRCYLQMIDILRIERGIERSNSMTSQEFERVLISYDFPEKAVHQLTTLFEKVRYGNKPIDTDDEQTAVSCLNSITGKEGGS